MDTNYFFWSSTSLEQTKFKKSISQKQVKLLISLPCLKKEILTKKNIIPNVALGLVLKHHVVYNKCCILLIDLFSTQIRDCNLLYTISKKIILGLAFKS